MKWHKRKGGQCGCFNFIRIKIFYYQILSHPSHGHPKDAFLVEVRLAISSRRRFTSHPEGVISSD